MRARGTRGEVNRYEQGHTPGGILQDQEMSGVPRTVDTPAASSACCLNRSGLGPPKRLCAAYDCRRRRCSPARLSDYPTGGGTCPEVSVCKPQFVDGRFDISACACVPPAWSCEGGGDMCGYGACPPGQVCVIYETIGSCVGVCGSG